MSDALIKCFFTHAGVIFRPVTLLIAMIVPLNAASAEDFLVQYDQARLIRLARPAHDIIVGNPSIADVSIQAKQLLVVTGKSFGVTNIIVLDAEGAVIINRKMIVQGDDTKYVNLQKGEMRQSYNCFPTCQPALVIGDQASFGDAVGKAIQQKNMVSNGGSAPNPGN